MEWHFNGLLIQDLNDFNDNQNHFPYLGIGRYYSWPLNKKNDEISKRLTDEADERWFNYYNGNEFSLAVIPSLEFIKRYFKTCNSFGINMRILYIETNREKPNCPKFYVEKEFVGYDYATSQDFFSFVYDDLYGTDTPETLIDFKLKLNDKGLFDSESILTTYIETRNKSIEKGYELEDFGDFCKYKISIINDQSIFID